MHSWKIAAPNSIVRFLFVSQVYQFLRSHIGSFADGQLTDALKHLATDYTADPKVRKKVLAVLASWSRQFKDDPSAAGIAGLYRLVKTAQSSSRNVSEANREVLATEFALDDRPRESERRRREKEVAKRKAKEKKRLEEARSQKAASRTVTSRKQFNFEQVCVVFFPCTCPPGQVLTHILMIYRRSLRCSLQLQTRRLLQITWLTLSRSVCCNFEARWSCSCLTKAREHRER